uniref:Urotensin-2 n=1 Tax=Propithecus coquereli TaxID=379532 RepID=A0A2K6F7L4_PROCO
HVMLTHRSTSLCLGYSNIKGSLLYILDLGLERASLLQVLPETVGVGRGDAPREAGPSTNVFNPRGNLRKFQAFSGQDPFNIFLSHLLAGTRKEYKKRGTPSECFWKYCV